MGHVLKGSGKIYEVYSLLYDLSILSQQISFEVRITLDDNRNNRPPTILTPQIESRLTKGRGKARPKQLTPRQCEFCYSDGSNNSTYLPFSENKSDFLDTVKSFLLVHDLFETITYNSEKWTEGVEKLT